MTPARPLPGLLALVLAATLSACGGSGDDSAPAPAPAAPRVAGEVLVQLRPGVDVAALAAERGATVLDRFGRRPIWRLRTAAGADLDATIAALRADARVQFAEANVEGETPEGRRRAVWAVGGDAGVYAGQWAPASMRLAEAHARSRGAGIRVAVLDTGLDATHPLFAGRVGAGRDFVDDDADPAEAGGSGDAGFGHGTHVAGLVLLAAPDATLMPARVLDAQGRGNAWVLAEALGWAVDPDADPATDDGAHVINLSLGTTQPTQLLTTAITLARCDFDEDDDEFDDPGFDDDRARCALKRGAVVLAAAGNDGSENGVQWPAAEDVPGSLAIAAHTEAAALAGFTNRGAPVKIAAPGEAIVSSVPGGRWAVWSGTSMATPLAAGTAALVLGALPDPRGVLPLDVAKRLTDRSAALCGSPLRKLDAAAAVTDTAAVDPACR